MYKLLTSLTHLQIDTYVCYFLCIYRLALSPILCTGNQFLTCTNMNILQITEEWRQIDYHDPDASVMGIIKITDVSKIYVLVKFS